MTENIKGIVSRDIRPLDFTFETALGKEPGDQVGWIHEKCQMSKVSWDYPFKKICFALERMYMWERVGAEALQGFIYIIKGDGKGKKCER
jgi:hypothetical protein